MNWIVFAVAAFGFFANMSIRQVSASGLFELRLKHFSNDKGKDNVGECCSGVSDDSGNCIGTCHTKFRVCMTHYQAKIEVGAKCTFGDIWTPVLGDNSVNLTTQSTQALGFVNPIRFPFDTTWPGTFTLIVEAWHGNTDNGSRTAGTLISRLSIQRVLDISSEWSEDSNDSDGGGGARSPLQYDFRVTCDEHYYGKGCANLCRPRDDPFGHYECSETGDRVCVAGWQGDYCTKPRCAPGCDEQHGHCVKPYECACQLGWKGTNCDECETYPGCVHGTCTIPWTCRCVEGWGGLFCNQDLNYCTNHRPCQNGGTCLNTGEGSYTCVCPPGYSGTDCDAPISNCSDTPCLNGGTCAAATAGDTGYHYRCDCRNGWTGRHCESKTIQCVEQPCLQGSTCHDTSAGFQCTCAPGFSGKQCDQSVQHQQQTHHSTGHGHGSRSHGGHSHDHQANGGSASDGGGCPVQRCENGGVCVGSQCRCPAGFAGASCELNVDDCSGSGDAAPRCQNGGTCVDMVNQYRCHCVPGYIGTNCEERVDLCLTKPCANGGTCQNLHNDYRCTCRPGFAGRDCSVDIDECASGPCQNGGTCVNRVNNFMCVCASGFRGDLCDMDLTYAAGAGSASGYSDSVAATHHEAQSVVGPTAGLSGGQVVAIALLSVLMPVIALSAACIVICMKKQRKRAQQKEDAEARKQNEQNATQNMHQAGISLMSQKQSGGGGGGLGNGGVNGIGGGVGYGEATGLSAGGVQAPTIIKNTWDKHGGSNGNGSASMEDCLLNTSLYGAISNYGDMTANSDCYVVQQQQQQQQHQHQQLSQQQQQQQHQLVQQQQQATLLHGVPAAAAVVVVAGPLQRARSQKQLNTDPSVMHRASQIIHPKEFVLDHNRMSVIGGVGDGGGCAAAIGGAAAVSSSSSTVSASSCASTSGAQQPPHIADAQSLCQQQQQQQQQRWSPISSPHKAHHRPCAP